MSLFINKNDELKERLQKSEKEPDIKRRLEKISRWRFASSKNFN
jgi:hypothetical protein